MNVQTQRTAQVGGASFEYIIVFAVVALVLVSGSPSPIQQVLIAIADRFSRFTFLVSLP